MGNELNSANEQQGLGVAVLVLVLIISPVIIFLVRSATITIQVKRGHHDLFWDCFNTSGLLLEPGPQGIWAEYGEKEGGQTSLSGLDFTFYLKHFASDAAAHSGPGASTQKGSYRRNLWISHGKRLRVSYFNKTFTEGNMGWFIKICYHRWYFIVGGGSSQMITILHWGVGINVISITKRGGRALGYVF